MSENEYQCAMCCGIFDKAWTDEEAEAELASDFGAVPLDECEVVCDDCYQRVRPSAHRDLLAKWREEFTSRGRK